jgi:hypothetical protein
MSKPIKISQDVMNKMTDIISRYTNLSTDIAIATLKYILNTFMCNTILTSKIKPTIAAVMPKYRKNNRLCCLIMDDVPTDKKIAKLLNKKQKEVILKIKEDILKELNVELSIETL